MNNLSDNLVNHIYDYPIDEKDIWKSKFLNVTNDITYSNADDIVSDDFSTNNAKYRDLDIDIYKFVVFP